ncbi:DUF4402 domain-containing protein [Shewanella sp.]|uniref:DUF4402 domain-containing protein n=1 Tax=Shewanella sp. TaxID=50422 RepID=UPI004053D2F9
MNVFILATAVAQAHFTLVSPLGIEENQQLNLGKITNQVSLYCQLDANQRQGNGCVNSESQLAKFYFSGAPQTQIKIMLQSVSNSEFTFTPLLPNGSQSQTFSLEQGPLAVAIGGRLDINAAANEGQQQISYTIEVNYL